MQKSQAGVVAAKEEEIARNLTDPSTRQPTEESKEPLLSHNASYNVPWAMSEWITEHISYVGIKYGVLQVCTTMRLDETIYSRRANNIGFYDLKA